MKPERPEKRAEDDSLNPDELTILARDQRRQDRHSARMQDLHRTGYRRCDRRFRRTSGWAIARRQEKRARRRALVFCRWAAMNGWSLPRCAQVLGVQPGTLKDWRQRWHEDRLAEQPLGAPAIPIDRWTRQQVVDLVMLLGVGVGERALHRHFPELPRRVLADILAETRDQLHEEARCHHNHEITWDRPGAVWAIDYTFPGNDIDHEFPAILTVRDLGSGCVLLFAPVLHADAATTVLHLVHLFRRYGPPLVLKADNGSHFTADLVSALRQEHRVTPLFSPIYIPAFNGSVEAAQGSLKSRTQAIAARDGDPFTWTSSHVEGARLWFNHAPAADRHGALPSADDRFANRRPIADHERAQFQRVVASLLGSTATQVQHELNQRHRRALEQGQQPAGQAPQPDIAAPATPANFPSDALHRRAVAAAMSACGLYTTRRRLVRLPDPRGERS
jgi:transposase InsO family protein